MPPNVLFSAKSFGAFVGGRKQVELEISVSSEVIICTKNVQSGFFNE